MIQIYDVGNTNYNKNGDIVLTPISAIIHPILNGAWEAELTHPIDKEGRWKHIVEEAVVKMPGFYEHWEDQLFRIKTVEKQDSGVTATMEPIFYDAMGDCFLTDVRAVQESGQQALTTMLSPNTKYSASSNITKVNTAYYSYVNFLEALNGDIDQSFIKRWGGEILYNNYQVVVNEQVGGDYGVELRYGKNIPQDGMQFTADVRDIVTRLYPKAYNGRKLSGSGYVDSPLINNYPVVMAATLTFENIKLRQDMEDTEAAEDNVIICEDQEELDQVLTEQCQAQFEAGIDKPKITISVDMVLLQNTEQYKDIKQLETVSLGDIVHCRNTHLGITNDARVIELEYDCIRRKVTSAVLGDYEYSYFDDVSSTTQIVQGIINPDGSVMAERVQGILNGIYTQLRLQSTAAQKVDGVAFKVEDLDPDSPLYGCMIWGTQGIQISTTRTADGRDWDWTTAITAQGIVANAIVTGLLSDKTGNNYWDLDTGEFRLSSAGFEVDGETLEDYINNSLTQQQIFNKLTNNGQLQGIYMQDGLLYINGTYIKAGIITDNVGKNYWNLNTGEFRLSANSTVGGEPIATQNNTISDVDVEYAVGDSDTTAPTTGWSTASPQWQSGKYIWQRTVTTMQDGTQNTSEPTCIQGAAGQNGTDGTDGKDGQDGAQGEQGVGVESVVDQYYLSNSPTEPSGGFWSETQPAWKLGFYIWTRSVVTYTDGNVEETEPILAQAINSANQSASDANQAVTDLDSSLNQEGVFNRLTNNGQTQGIYLQDGILYINASYIQSGTIKGSLINARNLIVTDNNGNTTFAIDGNGNVSIRCMSFSLNGTSIQTIANNAADGALNDAKDYTDQQLTGFTPDLTQEEVFNALTNNGQLQGIYMENGSLYINASYIDTGNLAGWIIDRANRKIYCSANTVFGTTTITLDAGSGEISVVNNSRGINTTIDHYGVNSTSVQATNLWGHNLNVGNDGSSVVITDGSASFFIPIYADNIQSSGNITFSGLVRLSGTTNIPGALNTNGKVSFGADGQGEGDFNVHDIAYFYNDIYYTNAPQTGGGDYMRIGSSGRVFRQGSSSRRYKNHIRYMDAEEAENLYNIPVIFFKYKDGYLTKDDPKIDEALPGFYAEDIAEYVPGAADYKNIDGQRLPENWDSRYLIPYMVKCIQEQHKEIEILKRNQEKILQALASAGIEV